jgi:hypothetical protein
MPRICFRITACAVLLPFILGCHSSKTTVTPSSNPEPAAKSEATPASSEKPHCDEVDRTDNFPWTGVAFEAQTGKLLAPLPASYVVSISRSWHKPNDAQAFKVLEDHTYRVLGSINSGEIGKGLLGYRFSSSEMCKTALIMAIWESEELMNEFYLSDPHMKAVDASSGNVRHAESTHWTRNDPTPPSFAEATSKLNAVTNE